MTSEKNCSQKCCVPSHVFAKALFIIRNSGNVDFISKEMALLRQKISDLNYNTACFAGLFQFFTFSTPILPYFKKDIKHLYIYYIWKQTPIDITHHWNLKIEKKFCFVTFQRSTHNIPIWNTLAPTTRRAWNFP